ncbi:MAG TPA: N-acetylglucosamine-6-phosphate deacetylase [Chloroflexota bacterium]|nr:N-acetylglucosamine-6-phosphate deacetylase [Chloroflexota bacterium]
MPPDGPAGSGGAMLAITGGTLVGAKGAPRPGTILIGGGRIVAVGAAHEVDVPAQAQRLDADGGYIVPGFIDVHVHGAAGADFMDATPEAIRTVCGFHASGGTTALLATTAAAPQEELVAVLDAIGAVRAAGTGGAALLGVHLEGPYFAPAKCGCHLPGEVRPPRAAEYEALLDRQPGLVRWMTLAPELPGALELIGALRRRGATPAAGHTEATEPQLRRAIEAGLRHATHLYCAMSTITKDGPRRIPGLVETALVADELSTEVIADGHHVPPTLLKLAARAKGAAKLLLVTDAMRGAGMPDGTYTFGPLHGTPAVVSGGVARTLDNSGYASSTARMIDLVRNMVQLAGCTLSEAVQMASYSPALALGLAGRKGTLEPGKDADVVVLDRELRVRGTVAGGQIVFQDPRAVESLQSS